MSQRSGASYPQHRFAPWLSVDLGASIVDIQTTAPLGPKDLHALYTCLAQHAYRVRKARSFDECPGVLLRRLSKYADARITIVGQFDPNALGRLQAAINDRRSLDLPEIDARRQAAEERHRARLTARRHLAELGKSLTR